MQNLLRPCARKGVEASDSQLYEAFDLTSYDYDIWTAYERYVRGEIPLTGIWNSVLQDM